ncbi:MAG TPA: DUF3857 and transglutaminase domain-containing protein [Candidatus Dormibacteraeota bacterium]|jgi:hypothetical protein|nr:DUF3857 and transglutaminase domain-containing protein [Candidatus Dormibacteraeota bacterium]
MNAFRNVFFPSAVAAVLVAFAPLSAKADAPAWMHAAASAPLPAYDEKTDAVLLYAEDAATVTPDGKMKGYARRVYKILRPEGRRYAVAHAYMNSEQRVGSMHGWCIPKQGKDYEVKDKDAVERSGAAGWELASDAKLKMLEIPGGEPGSVVGYEIEYQARPFVLEDEWNFQETIPVKEARYSLQMPPGWEYSAVWLNHAKVEPNDKGGNQWQWVVSDVPAIRVEKHMPPFSGLAGRMVVAFLGPGATRRNSFLTWDDMGKWQRDLANGRREATPEIRQKFAELTVGQDTTQKKLQAISKFLQKDIRYVAIELGIGGWQPHAASDVFAHKYGDCKDKATLLSTMLKLADIDSYYVFINTERGAVGPETPPMRIFDHAILAIKLPDQVQDTRYMAVLNHPKLGRLLIFDPTDEKTPIGNLSGELQTSYAFLVTPDGGELILTPQLPAASNGISHIGHLTLDANGTLRGQMNVMRKGDFATYERYEQISVQSSKDRVKRIEQEVAHSIGMFDITSAQMLNLDATDLPFGYVFNLAATAYAKPAGNLLMVRPRVLGVRSNGLMEEKEPRKFPVIFNGPEKDVDSFEITLPAGYEVDDLPPPVDVDYSFASYHSKTEKKNDVLLYTRTFEIKELIVPTEKLDELKKLYRMIASDERSTAVLKPKS